VKRFSSHSVGAAALFEQWVQQITWSGTSVHLVIILRERGEEREKKRGEETGRTTNRHRGTGG
jgi:hypothetical protein